MDYVRFYDYVKEEQARLEETDVLGDYRAVKALAACYELQEHLANRIAEEDDEEAHKPT